MTEKNSFYDNVFDLPFFTSVRSFNLAKEPKVHLSSVRFSLLHYSDDLFEHIGIAFPNKLARSVTKRRAEYLASRLAARRVMAHLGIPEFQLANAPDRSPIWPEKINASLSHSHGHAVVVGTRHPILLGVDTEKIMSLDRAKTLCSKIINLDEKRLLDQTPVPFSTSFTLVFSLKESLYKALYPRVRLFMSFDQAALTGWDMQNGRATLALTRDISPEFPAGRLCQFLFWIQKKEVLTLAILPYA